MDLYEAVADLPVTIENERRTRHRADTTSGFERVTTEIALSGRGETGRGEDVTYETADHEAFADAPAVGIEGEWTVDSLSDRLAEIDLFETKPPEREGFRAYRRWAYESAALDLALRQADADLASVLDRALDPARFVVSTRLGDPPSADRVARLLETDPDLEFKLDPTPDWTADLVETLVETDAVRVLDLKGWYEGTDVDVPADPELYDRVLEAFPAAVVEDAAFTDDTHDRLAGAAERLSFDYPVTDLESLRSLPVDPGWCNVKPSRFGSIRSLFETVEYCRGNGIRCYGGGQFELGVGRGQIQVLASLLYPDGPNDVAPRAFNDPDASPPYPTSPIAIDDLEGFRRQR
ncbi:enolase-like domain-containing protein [Halopenitus persicus]|uniref:hypothetical protein n=1 Tax=Halopenitus persicus TaxID=1048396 RepID=UPI000BBA8E67|nr:hypothetical protein [Halopenitus persicus]